MNEIKEKTVIRKIGRLPVFKSKEDFLEYVKKQKEKEKEKKDEV